MLTEAQGMGDEEFLPKEKELPKEDQEEALERLEQDLTKEKQRAVEYFRQLQYLQADFENYRRRVEREMSDAKQASIETLVVSLLTTLDELELATRAAKEPEGRETLLKGLEMVYGNLFSLLEGQGLSKIEALGCRFDPKKHEVVEKVSDEASEEGVIVGEIRKGFTFRGKVIRPSLVRVTVRPSTREEGGKDS